MDDLTFTTIDFVILGTLLLSAFFAWGRGLVHELLSLVAWAGSALITIYGFGSARPYAYEILAVPILADIVLALVLFIVSLLLLSFIARSIAGRVKESKLKPLDRGLGLFFGLVRGGIIVSLIYLMFAWMVPPEDHPDWSARSMLLPFVGLGASFLDDLVSDSEEKAGTESVLRAKDRALDAISLAPILDIFTDSTAKSADMEEKSGYNKKERSAMKRLIGSHQ